MSLAARREYQNTTVRLPRQMYEHVKKVVIQSQAASLNEFVVQAIEEKMRRVTEAEIDAAFAQMAGDIDYQRAAIELTREFEKSDWEALDSVSRLRRSRNQRAGNKQSRHERPTIHTSKPRTSKTRSR
jgi:hypothetical protein